MAGKFTKNILITLATRASKLLFIMGTSVIIARILGPEGKGIHSLAILLPTLLITFTNLGIGPASVYHVGQKKYSSKEVFGANIIFSFLISIFAIIIGLIVIFFFGERVFPGVRKEYLILALSLIPFQLFYNFVIDVLLGLQKIKKYNFVHLIQGFSFLLLIAVFLLGLHFGIKTAIATQVISVFVSSILLFFWTKKETKGISFKLNKAHFRDFLSYGGKIYLGNIVGFLHHRSDMFLTNIFLSPLEVGFYSVAMGLSEQSWLISQSAGTVIFPKVSSEKDGKRLKEFTPPIAASANRILANDISGRGKPIINSYIGGGAVVLNVILNIIWIPTFGIIGSAWATVVSYSVNLLIRMTVYSKISGNRIRDIIFIKKSDFRLYKRFIRNFLTKRRYK